jgi:hypothetical protein
MERHETHGTSRSGDVSDTIAFGSMLVFASVMPPLGPDTAETDTRPRRQHRVAGEDGMPDLSPVEIAARRSTERLDS